VTALPTLPAIVDESRARAAKRECELAAGRGALEAAARASAAARRPFAAALARRPFTLIAEIKRASPSAGELRPRLDPGELARDYESGGAAALSILTCEPWFRGSPEDLRRARESCALPLLCKDFVVTPFQVVEAAAAGADAILLIAAALADRELAALAALARSFALEPLFEAHDEGELERVVAAGAAVVGVNSRDLRTMRVDPAAALRLGARIPSKVHGVFESGVRGGGDLRAAAEAGFRSALVGEALLRSESPGAALSALLLEARLA
jgi:indole-3-glycerol phosphate synthase